jgi:hypothetical protein
MANQLLSKPKVNLNEFKLNLRVNPGTFYCEPQITWRKFNWQLDVMRRLLAKFHQILKLSTILNQIQHLEASLNFNSKSITHLEKFQ